jgi:hypothetical protein
MRSVCTMFAVGFLERGHIEGQTIVRASGVSAQR